MFTVDEETLLELFNNFPNHEFIFCKPEYVAQLSQNYATLGLPQVKVKIQIKN